MTAVSAAELDQVAKRIGNALRNSGTEPDSASNVPNLVNKLSSVESYLSRRRGRFRLFVLLKREDAPTLWDVLVSAQWIEKEKNRALRIVAERIQRSITQTESLLLSRIVPLPADAPVVKAFQQAIQVEHGQVALQRVNLFGMNIEEAYLLTSRRDGSQVMKRPAKKVAKPPG